MSKLYGFTDINKRRLDQYVNPDGIIWNGHDLDEEILGLKTLTAEGREDYTRSITSTDRVGDGQSFRRSKVESREIVINFYLDTRNSDELNLALRLLNNTLQGNEQQFSFHDEQEYFFIGTVTEVVLDDVGKYNPKGHFTITLTDPFKYSFSKEFKSTNTKPSSWVIPDAELIYEGKVMKITTAALPAAHKKLVATLYRAGVAVAKVEYDTVQAGVQVINFDQKNVFSNNANWNAHMEFTSNFASWKILQWDSIEVVVDGAKIDYTLEYEVRYL